MVKMKSKDMERTEDRGHLSRLCSTERSWASSTLVKTPAQPRVIEWASINMNRCHNRFIIRAKVKAL